ncbi:hypothetical protein GCM10022206_50210 [Streptomyces chiangmaiensis]
MRSVHREAFGDHGPVVAELTDALRDSLVPGGGLSLVAEQADEVVGHVMFTRSVSGQLGDPVRTVRSGVGSAHLGGAA